MEEKLISIIRQSPEIEETLSVCTEYGLPNYYLAGGAITGSYTQYRNAYTAQLRLAILGLAW